MKIHELMKPSVVSVLTDDSAATAAKLLSRHNIGSLPVVSHDGELVGIITDRDIVLRCVAAGTNPENTVVGDIMTRKVISISPEEEVSNAAAIMSDEKVRRLPVVENGRLKGILSLGDIARSRGFYMEAAQALGDISTNITRKQGKKLKP